MTITIPDWLLDSHFWGGFGTCFVLCFLFALYVASNLNPWGR